MKKLICLMIVIGVISFNFSLAQSAKPDTATKNFITTATIAGLQEINSGKLAVQKATNPSIRAFGERMIKDHSKANAQLAQIVQSKGYPMSPKINVVVPDKMLSTTTGAAFDQNYVDMMLGDHRHAVHLFENYAINGKDPEIKAFAQQTLPTLKDHLAAIEAINAKMKRVSK